MCFDLKSSVLAYRGKTAEALSFSNKLWVYEKAKNSTRKTQLKAAGPDDIPVEV